jgi:lantibiotic modifying enzyme
MSATTQTSVFAALVASSAARSLDERLASPPRPPRPGEDPEAVLARWAKAAAGGDPVALARRLSWSGLEPRLAVAAWCDPQDDPPAALPEWVERVGQRAAERAGDPAVHAGLGRAATRPFAELWRPWSEVAAAEARRRCGAAAGEWSEAAWGDLEAALAARLAWLGGRAAYASFDRFRDAAPDWSGCYAEFVGRLLAGGLAELYREFPVLLRKSIAVAGGWLEATVEASLRLAGDREELERRFADGRPLGAVSAVEAPASDPHRGGRKVLVLAFESGSRLVYKPRPVAQEALLAAWVEWMTAHGFEDAPPAARTWARDGYGWQEYVEAGSLADASAAQRYFRRAGALVALGYALRAGDLHAENLVATPRGPVVIDAEMLLQPLPASAVDSSGRPRAEADPQGHALASALVVDPSRVSAIAWGGLDPPPEGLGEPEPRFTGIGSDALALTSERAPIAAGANVARLAGRALAAAEYREALLAGFAAAYRFLLARRAAILAPGGALAVAADHPVRVLFRPSRQYATVLQMSTAPARLADGRESGLVLEALLAPFAGRRERPPLWPLVTEERAAIERLDVPYFTLPASASEPRSTGGVALRGVFALSGLEAARAGLERWSERDLARQLRLLGEALEPPPAALRGAIDGTLTLAAGGRALAQRLRQHLAHEPPAALDGTWSAASLYSGWSGRALVAAGIAATLGEEWARHEAERAGHRALAAARAAAQAAEGEERPQVGVAVGSGAVVWGLLWAARLARLPALAAEALRLARDLDATAPEPQVDDLHGGAAGALLARLAAGAAGDEHALAAARAMGDRLLSRMASGSLGRLDPRLPAATGWAHGAAGIARALAALARRTGDPSYAAAARELFAGERPLFDATRGDWPAWFLPPDGGEAERGWPAAWCTGAPGVAVARAFASAGPGESELDGAQVRADAALERELAIAVATTERAAPPAFDHLCCGSFGRVAALAAVARRRGDGAALERAESLALSVLARAERVGFRLDGDAGTGQGRVWSLFRGLAGIAWTLLDLASPQTLPLLAGFELADEFDHRTRRNLA